jgi:hypothetical protein
VAYTEILTGHGLTEEQWDNDIFKEYIGQLWWKNVMGTSSNAIIQVKEDLTKQPGDAITIGLRGLMQGGHVTGNAKASGNEGKVDFYSHRVVIDNERYVIKIEDVPMTQKRVGFDVLMQAKEALVQKSQEGTDDDITTELSTTTNRVRGRYLYGAADSNWNATHATALQNIDNAADKLTSDMIDIAKRKALIPVNATKKMRPMRIMMGKNFEEWYISVNHTYAIRDLVNNDAAFRNAQLLLPPNANRSSVLYTGSSFKGSWNGTLIYDYDRIALVSSTIQCAHNLFLGAQACALVWGQRAKFGEEESDVGHDMTFETHEIRGIEKLEFTDMSTPEDHGIVHTFSAAVAD